MDAQVESAPLTVEQMRDTISRLVQGINASDPKELAGELFRDNGDFAAALLDALPRLVAAASEAARVFAESLEGMPIEKSTELISSTYSRVDGREIGKTLNALSRLLVRLHEENPELFSAGRTGVVADVMETADFGKLRKAMTYRGGEYLGTLRGEVELLGENPVALVNIFSVVAPLVNDAIQVLKSVTEILALPAEAMTYALFKILEDIDWRELAEVVNGAASLVVTIHRGSYVIGDGSLYTRGPFSRISSGLLAGLDGRKLAEAIAGAGEEAEAFLAAFAGQLLDDADMAVPLAEAVVSLANSSFRVATAVLEKAASIPAGTMDGIARAVAEDLEVVELARALNALSAAGRRLLEDNPGLANKLSHELVSGLDLELRPEGMAAVANRALSSYNGWARRNPGLAADAVGGFLAGIDARELEQAAKTAGAQVADALARNPGVIKAVARAVLTIAYGSARGYVKGLRDTRKARKG